MKVQVGIEYYIDLSGKNLVLDLQESVWNMSLWDNANYQCIQTFRTNYM